MTDIEMVKKLSGVTDDFPTELVEFYISISEDFIKNYCHLDAVPEQLHSTLIQIAAIKTRANSDGTASTLGAGVSSVTSVSDSGQSVSWGRVTSSKNFIGDDDIITTFGAVLDRFRRFDSKTHYGSDCPSKTRRMY